MSPDPKLTSQIAIVGAGDVGATIAYSLIMNPVAGDILMVDPKEEVRDAQVQDLSDATFHGNTSTRVRAGTHKEAGQCDIIVMTAGAKQKKGMHLEIRSSYCMLMDYRRVKGRLDRAQQIHPRVRHLRHAAIAL
jgi:predicted dinucleotide-binding enzyme